MKYFFEDTEKQEQLKKILDEWMGTPFRHHCGVKGLGCDCIHFAVKVFEEMELIKWRDNLIPDYPRDWHLHNTRELLKEAIEKEFDVEEIGLDNLMNGDIILSHYGQASSHTAIYFDEHVYQAIDDIGVCKIHISDRVFRRQMKFAYRILA